MPSVLRSQPSPRALPPSALSRSHAEVHELPVLPVVLRHRSAVPSAPVDQHLHVSGCSKEHQSVQLLACQQSRSESCSWPRQRHPVVVALQAPGQTVQAVHAGIDSSAEHKPSLRYSSQRYRVAQLLADAGKVAQSVAAVCLQVVAVEAWVSAAVPREPVGTPQQWHAYELQ